MIPLPSLKIIAALVLAAGLAASHWQAYVMGAAKTEAAWAKDSLERERATLKAMEAVNAQELAIQTKLRKANDDLQNEKKRRAADAVLAADSLREFQSALGGDPGPGDSAAPSRTHGTGGLESELLGNCAQALVGLGQEAGRLAGKVVGLQDYIKAACPALQPAQP